MLKQSIHVLGYLLFAALLAACAGGPTVVVVVPDTAPGDQILNDYLVAKWCTNREQTAISNQAAGFSGLLNVRPVFWRFAAQGEWDISTSGFLYESWGSWKIEGLDELQIAKKGATPKIYQIYFINEEEGLNLYLVDDKGQFTVLSHCE